MPCKCSTVPLSGTPALAGSHQACSFTPSAVVRVTSRYCRCALAALETKDASEWLDKADKAYRDKEDQKKVDQLAYLTNQRVEVAKDTIALRESEDQS